jgi:hypothetical protein
LLKEMKKSDRKAASKMSEHAKASTASKKLLKSRTQKKQPHLGTSKRNLLHFVFLIDEINFLQTHAASPPRGRPDPPPEPRRRLSRQPPGLRHSLKPASVAARVPVQAAAGFRRGQRTGVTSPPRALLDRLSPQSSPRRG